jgi:hypothetical protein
MSYMKKGLMMKVICALCIVLTSGVYKMTNGAPQQQTVTVNYTVYSCSCTGCTCNFYVNAVGDLRDIKVSAREQSLGAINTPLDVTITIPRIDQQLLYSLKITKPYSQKKLDVELVGKQIFLLFITEKPDTQTLQLQPTCQAMTKVYRRVADEQLWTEIATLTFSSSVDGLPPFLMHVNTNGQVSWMEGIEQKIIPLGKAILN